MQGSLSRLTGGHKTPASSRKTVAEQSMSRGTHLDSLFGSSVQSSMTSKFSRSPGPAAGTSCAVYRLQTLLARCRSVHVSLVLFSLFMVTVDVLVASMYGDTFVPHHVLAPAHAPIVAMVLLRWLGISTHALMATGVALVASFALPTSVLIATIVSTPLIALEKSVYWWRLGEGVALLLALLCLMVFDSAQHEIQRKNGFVLQYAAYRAHRQAEAVLHNLMPHSVRSDTVPSHPILSHLTSLHNRQASSFILAPTQSLISCLLYRR